MSSQEMEQIIQEYGDDIYRFCFHLTGSREEADDLYQDTFVKAIQIGHRLDRSGNIKSFLMGQPMEKPDEKGQTSERIDTGSQL